MESRGIDLMTPQMVDSSLTSEAPQGFGDRLHQLVNQRSSQLVLGLDPDPARLWPRAIELARGAGDTPAPQTAAGASWFDPVAARAAIAVTHHCRLAIDSAGQECVAVKFQVACFE